MNSFLQDFINALSVGFNMQEILDINLNHQEGKVFVTVAKKNSNNNNPENEVSQMNFLTYKYIH